MSKLAFKPLGLPRSVYAERPRSVENRLDQACKRLIAPVTQFLHVRDLRSERFVKAVADQGRRREALNSSQIRSWAEDLRQRLQARSLSLEVVAESFALIRQAAGQVLGMQHFDAQIIGGWILINGMIAEMDTGEGKTLTATLPAATAALAGLPVHVVTVNDYLASRDAKLMRPLYEALGLTVGVVTAGISSDERQQAYACSITYCTNKELVFDYLRDRITLGRKPLRIHRQIARLIEPAAQHPHVLLRGLHFAIVDEVDSVMIDEAQTPLIISEQSQGGAETELYQAALSAAAELQSGVDFTVDPRARQIQLTESGSARSDELLQPRDIAVNRWRREELIRQALTALHLMHRDTHYVIKDDKIQIVDEYTGRTMPDRSWEQGLHQLIETKEGCPLTAPNDSLSRISYQHFFRRYRRLAGMTGTASEVRAELWSVYGLAVVRVPTHRRSRRLHLRDRVYRNAESKWQAIVSRVAELHMQQRPILIGTRSVAASEHLSNLLSQAGLSHRVLNARQDQAEAAIIAEAGSLGQITVATNMAGRGTDIRLGPGVAELGGLHVIGTEPHESGRIDRQLWGRCARQGDPGSYEMIMSLEDEVVRTHGGLFSRLLGMLQCRTRVIDPRLGMLSLRWCQYVAERLNGCRRRNLIRLDEQLQRALAFSGKFE